MLRKFVRVRVCISTSYRERVRVCVTAWVRACLCQCVRVCGIEYPFTADGRRTLAMHYRGEIQWRFAPEEYRAEKRMLTPWLTWNGSGETHVGKHICRPWERTDHGITRSLITWLWANVNVLWYTPRRCRNSSTSIFARAGGIFSEYDLLAEILSIVKCHFWASCLPIQFTPVLLRFSAILKLLLFIYETRKLYVYDTCVRISETLQSN